MKKGYLVAIIALITAIVGVLIGLYAISKRKKCALCDDYDLDMLEDPDLYDDMDWEDEGHECCCGHCGDMADAEIEAPVEVEVEVEEQGEPIEG